MRTYIGLFVNPIFHAALVEQLQKEEYDSLSDMIRNVLAQYLIYKGYNLKPEDINMKSVPNKSWKGRKS